MIDAAFFTRKTATENAISRTIKGAARFRTWAGAQTAALMFEGLMHDAFSTRIVSFVGKNHMGDPREYAIVEVYNRDKRIGWLAPQ